MKLKFLLVSFCLIPLVFGQDESSSEESNELSEGCTGGDWGEWTEKCSTLKDEETGKLAYQALKKEIIGSCGKEGDFSQFEEPPWPEDVPVPDRCGYCTAKFRCRSVTGEGCFPFQLEKQICEDYGDVCDLPKTIAGDCLWAGATNRLKQCANKVGQPEVLRQGMNKYAQIMIGEPNCIAKGDRCACCCHPYTPSDDGTTCVKQEPPQNCDEFSEWNDFSECLWYPLEEMRTKVIDHCEITPPAGSPPDSWALPTPPGMTIPEKCGFCSFRIRCRKRDATGDKEECHPVEMDKKICSKDDCETCEDICELPLLDERETPEGVSKCWYDSSFYKSMKDRALPMLTGLKGYWRKRGLLHIFKHTPLGKCVESDDKCKCCCHPYVPNEDGTACVLASYCGIPEGLIENPDVN